ncbi:hypothetical protein Ctob_003402 [Chrysochromulina tobinii]|uniref:Uncharacterized protein n=1 Tax=Chrysochromulina tobinii TaxID=1460289 RepID=A0A0M0J479_9EUKA|nr:hypothetical protein Ctob_003402 [Chrysochromulina tobinii]|eukprot:KOO21290.1 hypothetical protein Ctob_003402 [Chrysochromulina sp. CCMP291]
MGSKPSSPEIRPEIEGSPEIRPEIEGSPEIRPEIEGSPSLPGSAAPARQHSSLPPSSASSALVPSSPSSISPMRSSRMRLRSNGRAVPGMLTGAVEVGGTGAEGRPGAAGEGHSVRKSGRDTLDS